MTRYSRNDFICIYCCYCCCCCCCCCFRINSHNEVRGHRTGSSHSGAEEYPGEEHKQPTMVHAYITFDAIHASTRNISKWNRESVYDVPGPHRCIRHITHAWKNRLYGSPPKKDYHVYITRSIYYYAYARRRRPIEEKKQRKEKKIKERKEKRRKQNKKNEKGRERKEKDRKKSKKRQDKLSRLYAAFVVYTNSWFRLSGKRNHGGLASW